MLFHDRKHAGELLAIRLNGLVHPPAVVLALPRGGLPIARPVADRLGIPLDVLVARKLGLPGNPELAIGAVTASGERVLHEGLLRAVFLPPGYLEAETERQRKDAADRETRFRRGRPAIPLAGKQVVLVDDGIATGMTMLAAVEEVRRRAPREVLVAAPVMSRDAWAMLSRAADRVVAVDVPDAFGAVGQFYEHFDQVPDADAEAILAGVPA